MKTKLIQINLDEKTLNLIEQVRQDRGINSRTEAIRYCIKETHDRIFLNYKRIQQARLDPELIKERGISKADSSFESEERRKQLQEQKEFDDAKDICDAVGGNVTLDNLGLPVCNYLTYSMNGPWIIETTEVSMPLNMLDKETPARQYQGLFGEFGAEGKASIEAHRIKIANAKKTK